jgi:hypothetical protein
MLRMISPKALIVSNLALWLFVIVGMIFAMALYYAGLTMASDGVSNSADIWAEMKSSSAVIYLTAFTSIIAAGLAGYISARMAARAKLLNGALSISTWLLLIVYFAIRGSSRSSEIHVHVPFMLNFLTSYGIVIPALAGAYLGQLQASVSRSADELMPAAATPMPPHEMATVPSGSAPNQTKRRTYAGAGLGTFIFIISQLLLTKHEQNVLFVGLLVVIALTIAAAWVAKTLKGTRPRT